MDADAKMLACWLVLFIVMQAFKTNDINHVYNFLSFWKWEMLIKVHLYVKDQKTKLVKYRISDFVNDQFLQLFWYFYIAL